MPVVGEIVVVVVVVNFIVDFRVGSAIDPVIHTPVAFNIVEVLSVDTVDGVEAVEAVDETEISPDFASDFIFELPLV